MVSQIRLNKKCLFQISGQKRNYLKIEKKFQTITTEDLGSQIILEIIQTAIIEINESTV